MPRVLLAAPMKAVLVLAVLLAGCAAKEPADVLVLDRTYSPDALAVAAGEVVFENVDDQEHTVTVVAANATDTRVHDADVKAGARASVAFPPGAFVVYCRYHGDATSGQRMTVTAS